MSKENKDEPLSTNDRFIKSKPLLTNSDATPASGLPLSKQKLIEQAQPNVIEQTLSNDTPKQEAKDKKRPLEDVIVLSDDDDDEDDALHSFKLSKKLKRTKLSLSRNRKK